MRGLIRIVSSGLELAVVGLFATLMGLVFLQVVNRFLLGFQLFWTEEVVRFLFVWTVLLATPLTLLRRQEIKVDLLSFGNPAIERAKVFLATLASVVFCVILAWTGYQFTMRGVTAMSMTLGISRVWFYAPIPIGAALTVLAILVRPGEGADVPEAAEGSQ